MRSDRMRTALLPIVIAFSAGVAGMTQATPQAEQATSLTRLEAGLRSAISASNPPAKYSHADGELWVRTTTRHYQVHLHGMDGRVSPNPTDLEGPTDTGLMIEVQPLKKSEPMQAVLPFEFHEEHWTRYATLVSAGAEHKLLINFYWGKRTDPVLVKRIRKTIDQLERAE